LIGIIGIFKRDFFGAFTFFFKVRAFFGLLEKKVNLMRTIPEGLEKVL
jgi:hypothetical protein